MTGTRWKQASISSSLELINSDFQDSKQTNMKKQTYLLLATLMVVLSVPALRADDQSKVNPPNQLPFDCKNDPPLNLPITPGPYKPTWESLESQYQCPEWFRDAKFGIWAHWGFGSFYPQDYYRENKGVAVNPSATPSLKGAKDALLNFKAEHWDPVKLLTLYKENGAKYFMALGNHHDNFDQWNSRFQPWNSVNMGPHRDMIAEWQAAAKKLRLRFGVSSHAARAWEWYEGSQGVDKSGTPYDGNLTKADGKGLWWEGYDPQDLYAQYHHTPGKFSWDWDPKVTSTPSSAYMEKFYLRHKQLYENYHPDMMYYDDTVLPFHGITDQVGLALAAEVYNSSIALKQSNDVVMNCKKLDEAQRRGMVYDFERGRADRILPQPWQDDTCMGHWFYDPSYCRTATNSKSHYKTPQIVVRMLIDIVSKNGNLMLSVPLRKDGTPDDEEIEIVKGIGAWLKVNGDAIYATRPWFVYGEGPSLLDKCTPRDVSLNRLEDVRDQPYTASDIRFTQSKDHKALYAIALDIPKDGKLLVKTLATGAGKINEVSLLGYSGRLDWQQTPEGLAVTLPKEMPCDIACSIKILGENLKPVSADKK